MLFLNQLMLLGLLGIALPIFLHIFNRHRSEIRKWGAMLFLSASLAKRQRRVMLEELLLMITRCLIFAFAALTFSRPFVSAGSRVPWIMIAVSGILAIVGIAASAVLWQRKDLRKRIRIAAGAFAAFAILSVITEGFSTWRKLSHSGARDVAIIIDGSASMTINVDGVRNFDRAKKEADEFIQSCPRNTAFSLIVGGSVSQTLTPSPTTDRRMILRLLDEAVPLHGTLNAPDAIALAVTSLAQGYNGAKQILVLGDGQCVGWKLGDADVWAAISELLSRLPRKPPIVWRTLGIPANLRNLTISDIIFSRKIIGTDRDVRIDVTIVNNGTESATPASLTLSTEGETLTDSSTGQIHPGETRTVSFRHKFTKTGTHPVTAMLKIDDELIADNSMTRVAAVRDDIRVLVVEGITRHRLAERTGAFIALALAPDKDTVSAKSQTNLKPAATTVRESKPRFLVHPDLISAAELNTFSNFTKYAAIIFADVPHLTSNTASRVLAFVERGGGLLTTHSMRTDPTFYNSWRDADGISVMPLLLQGEKPSSLDAFPVDPKTLSHPAISSLAEQGDLATAIFECCWMSSESDASSVRVGGRFFNGSPLFADRRCGKGRIIQFTAALDPTAGNLISRQSFLPMVHELVYYLAKPVIPNLNILPSRGATLQLAGGNMPDSIDSSTSSGLRGVYYAGSNREKIIQVRIDPRIEFNWQQTGLTKELADNAFIGAEWTGSLTVPRSGRYRIYTHNGGVVTIAINGDKNSLGFRRSDITVDLEAGRRHDIVVTYNGRNRGGAYISLRWAAAGIINDTVIPTQFLSPVRVTDNEWVENYPTTVATQGSTELRNATIRLSQNSLSVTIPHRLTPGIYTISIPKAFAPQLTPLQARGIKDNLDGKETNNDIAIAFSVSTDGSESQLSTVTQEDVSLVSRFAHISLANDNESMVRAMNGSAVGRELWHYAAVPLLALLLLEILLTGWITSQRRTGEEGKVDFADANRPDSRFTEILRKVKDRGAAR